MGTDGQVLSANSAQSDGLEYVSLGVGSVRQSVQVGSVDSSGYANFVAAGSGLAVNLSATATPLVVAFANGFGKMGPQDLVSVISADSTGFISSLEASNTSFLFGTYSSKTAITWSKGLVPPDYAYAFDRTRGALLNFNGTDASTTMLDDFGNTWTASGDAQLDTAQQKFGSASLLLDGTGDYISSTNFTSLGPDSWEISFWFRINALPGVGSTALLFTFFNAAGNFPINLNISNSGGVSTLRLNA